MGIKILLRFRVPSLFIFYSLYFFFAHAGLFATAPIRPLLRVSCALCRWRTKSKMVLCMFCFCWTWLLGGVLFLARGSHSFVF